MAILACKNTGLVGKTWFLQLFMRLQGGNSTLTPGLEKKTPESLSEQRSKPLADIPLYLVYRDPYNGL